MLLKILLPRAMIYVVRINLRAAIFSLFSSYSLSSMQRSVVTTRNLIANHIISLPEGIHSVGTPELRQRIENHTKLKIRLHKLCLSSHFNVYQVNDLQHTPVNYLNVNLNEASVCESEIKFLTEGDKQRHVCTTRKQL